MLCSNNTLKYTIYIITDFEKNAYFDTSNAPRITNIDNERKKRKIFLNTL